MDEATSARGRQVNNAKRRAREILLERHADEFDALVEEELGKAGFVRKTVTKWVVDPDHQPEPELVPNQPY